jgi:hypothetical protein
LSTTNPTWPDPGLNPGRRGGKPATNRLSSGAAKRRVAYLVKEYDVSFKTENFIPYSDEPAPGPCPDSESHESTAHLHTLF